jgi:phosphatidate cytidylyltransferase
MAKRIVFGLLWTAIGISALVFMHTWVFLVFAMFLCFTATYELNRSIGLKNKPIMILSLAVSTVFPLYYEYGYLLQKIEVINLKTEYLITAYILVLCFLMLHNHENTKFSDVSFVAMSSLFVPFAFTRLVYFRDIALYYPDKGYTNAHGMFLILFILFSACMTDTCAYFAGSLLGKHKLCPKISPKKTIEGAVGGVIFDCIVMVAACIIFNCATKYTANIFLIGIATPILALASIFGDLIFSYIKRDCGIKDYGKIMPGHGGILDRFDSVITVAPLMYLILAHFPIVL